MYCSPTIATYQTHQELSDFTNLTIDKCINHEDILNRSSFLSQVQIFSYVACFVSLLFYLTSLKAGDHFAKTKLKQPKNTVFYNLTFSLPESKLPDLIQNVIKMLQEFLELKCRTETHKDRQAIFVPVIFTNTEFPICKFYTGETNRILQELFNAGLNTQGRSLRSSDVRSTSFSPR